MSQKVVALPLYSLGDFEYQVRLQGINVLLRFYLNSRQGVYHLEIYDASKQPLIQGLALLPETVILDEPVLEYAGLTGYFFLYPLSDKFTGELPQDPLTTPQYFGFAYIFEEE